MTYPDIEATAISCAEAGDTNRLYSLIHDHPRHFSKFLQDTDKLQFAQTPLHAAAAAGHTRFALEIMNLMPSLGKKLDPDGLSPLHVALREKRIESACSSRQTAGRDGFTPLLYAIKMNTDLGILAEFLMDNRFQNAVHVAIEANKCKAIVLLLNWLVWRAREAVLGWRDENGNTALHLAVQHDCAQGLKIMVGIAKLNKRNSVGETALDIAEKSEKTVMANVLRKAGARRSKDLPRKQTLEDYFISQVTILETLLRGYYFMLKDLATATYQAVLQPPGGVYQSEADKLSGRATMEVAAENHFPGKMVMELKDYRQFMPANTLAFTLSMVMIIFVLHGRPYNLILHMCLLFLAYSYLIAMTFVSGSDCLYKSMFVMSWFVIATAFLAKMLYYVVKALLVEDVWWLPRCRVISSNVWYRRRRARKTTWLARNLKRQYKLIQR